METKRLDLILTGGWVQELRDEESRRGDMATPLYNSHWNKTSLHLASQVPWRRRPGDDEKASWRGDNDDEDQGVWTLSTPPLCNLPLKSYDEEEEESWRDTTTKVMEEHDAEGRGAAGEDWRMKKTTEVVLVRRRLVVIRLKLGLVLVYLVCWFIV